MFLTAELERHPPGLTRVLTVFDALARWSAGLDRGCAFVNAYAEIGGSGHPGVPVIRAEKAWMRTLFTELVAEAGIHDAARIAGTVHLLYEGALVTATVGNDPDAFTAARNATDQLLSAERAAHQT